jgi:hypothetical protein
MWKVMFPSPYGGDPSIYWVTADSAPTAETTARQQAGSRITAEAPASVEHADDVDPEGEMWPRPRLVAGIRVFTFDDTRSAYDHTQIRDDIHDGDVLHIPSETVAGFLMQAWPVAISPGTGALHALTDPDNLVIDGVDYSASARVARTLLSAAESPVPLPPPVPTPVSRGLQYAADVWTVTIAGTERHDGEGPYIWIVNAPDSTIAAATAERHHQTSQEDTDTVVRSVEPGAPTADYPWAYNDLRGIPSKTIVLTPDNIRQVARIRLACKRLDRYAASVDVNPAEPFTEHEAQIIDDMTYYIATLVRQLLDDLGYSACPTPATKPLAAPARTCHWQGATCQPLTPRPVGRGSPISVSGTVTDSDSEISVCDVVHASVGSGSPPRTESRSAATGGTGSTATCWPPASAVWHGSRK